MRSSPFGRLLRSKSLRVPTIALTMAFALNVSGCHGGRRTAMRPRFFGTTRSQAVVVEQGYTAVESPGAVIQQQQGATIIEQGQTVRGNTGGEPPITLEPRDSGTTTSVVPSFGDVQQPGASGTSILTPRSGSSARSVIDSLAPPAEAPQAIMEAPPVSNLDQSPPRTSSPIDSSIKGAEPGPGEEPRLEVLPPGSSGSGAGGKEPAASKTSAWRNQSPGTSGTRMTYQASTRKSIGSGDPEDPLGTID